MRGPSGGQMPPCTGYDEGTHMEEQQPLPYEPLQSLQRCIAKATERARVKSNSSTRCDSEWHTLEKYLPSASYTQPSLGKGAQFVVHSESFCGRFEQTAGRDLGVLERSCLIMGKTMCTLLQWLFIQSLTSEPPSVLDRGLRNLMPSLSQIVTRLGRHHTITLIMSLVSTSLTVLALFMLLSRISESCRLQISFSIHALCYERSNQCWYPLVSLYNEEKIPKRHDTGRSASKGQPVGRRWHLTGPVLLLLDVPSASLKIWNVCIPYSPLELERLTCPDLLLVGSLFTNFLVKGVSHTVLVH